MKNETRWSPVVWVSTAGLLGMSVWFSGSAIVPSLRAEWALTDSQVSWITLSVQLGFVAGTLLSAFLNLPDVMNPRHLLALSGFMAAAANASIAWISHGPASAYGFRFATGMFLAGVYPPAMKVTASWFREQRGLAIGILVGAITAGKGMPYLFNALATEEWRTNLLLVSILPLLGSLIVFVLVKDGPFAPPRARFDWHQVGQVIHNRGVRLANLGYFGHMWELYAMWTWAPVMIRASLATTGENPAFAEIASFVVIGAGAVGSIVAGVFADRVGRTLTTSWSMIISGSCCVLIGFLFQKDAWWLLLIAGIWGASVVADSAQFSTSVTELGDPRYTGTALTLQTCIGFLLTTLSIHLISFLVPRVGWQYAFIALAPGPVFGVASMMRLRRLPESLNLAGGRR